MGSNSRDKELENESLKCHETIGIGELIVPYIYCSSKRGKWTRKYSSKKEKRKDWKYSSQRRLKGQTNFLSIQRQYDRKQNSLKKTKQKKKKK